MGQAKRMARRNEDGSYTALGRPSYRVKRYAKGEREWHRPSVTVPPEQWDPECRVNRYEFERLHTPSNQARFFDHLKAIYLVRPPTPAPAETLLRVRAMMRESDDGTWGIPEEGMAIMAAYDVQARSPDGVWRFTISAEADWEGFGLTERIMISHADTRTLPDWALLIRTRSWLWEDSRQAYQIMPDHETEYVNARFNGLHLFSPKSIVLDTWKPTP